MLPELGMRNVSYRTVARYVKQALDTMVPPAAEEARVAELARLDALAEAVADKVAPGDLKAVHTSLRISESRRRLLGLDAPTKVDATVTVTPLIKRVVDYGISVASGTRYGRQHPHELLRIFDLVSHLGGFN
jgi:hypothetical protein